MIITSLLFQAYPLALCAWVISLPEHKPLNFIGIFAVSEVLLLFILFIWKKKNESGIIDEREAEIRLQVSHFQLKVIEILFILSFMLSFTFFKEMSARSLLALMALPIVLGEIYANIKFRKLD